MSTARTITVELIPAKGTGGAAFTGRDGFVILKTIIRSNEGKPESIGKPLTCVGTMHEPIIGAHYKLTGAAEFAEKFNEFQLRFTKFELAQSAGSTGLQYYLAKECEHIGEGRADQIVKCYGDRTWEVLLTEPHSLAADITGIDAAKAEIIQKWAIAEQAVSSVKKNLYEAGLTQGLIKKLITAYGSGIEAKIKENVFDTTEIKGVGFLTADRIGKKFGMPPTHPQRIREGVLFAIQAVMDDKGHTCVEHHTLINAACKLLEIHKEPVIAVVKQMLTDRLLCTQRDDPKEFSRNPDLFSKPLELTP